MKTESTEYFEMLESREWNLAEQPENVIAMLIPTVDIVKNRLLYSLCSLLTVTGGFPSPLACDQSCKSCGPSSPRCLTCAEKTVLHDGKCIAECPGGYYAEVTGRCKGKTWIIIVVVIVIIKKCLTHLTILAAHLGICVYDEKMSN